jgi:hypothetical protein
MSLMLRRVRRADRRPNFLTTEPALPHICDINMCRMRVFVTLQRSCVLLINS